MSRKGLNVKYQVHEGPPNWKTPVSTEVAEPWGQEGCAPHIQTVPPGVVVSKSLLRAHPWPTNPVRAAWEAAKDLLLIL